ncbi:GNAT family N-acetyltransferase [Pantoea coffeiphila]|uniref:GNAT family N-acetyltransferase n=1 Tax=Pantoea coffeiphila TaxID=1465635 RepID=UPI0019607294|nr:GNAT family N-acetyltransferase [Pantoea coffeiphila]MBM7343459.1 ribosomal protein S18 acetylase RimI-like enzyme [Pantoea coffeiphila]
MKITITDKPAAADEEYVIDSLWTHNAKTTPVDIHPLFLTLRDEQNQIMAGLVARTWWGGLEVQYLWVSDDCRGKGVGRDLMQNAEQEARKRGCHMAYVDTFDFQARGFYEKLGYSVYGELGDYAHQHTRHYLAKKL